MTKLVERFLKYVKYDTESSETSGTHPSSEGQRVLAEELKKELEAMGAKDVYLSEMAYLYATIPASADRVSEPALGFLAHLDTSPDASGKDVKPSVITRDGEEIIVTDGTTLLGADDKLGVAIQMQLAEELLSSDAPSHREIRLAFTPDEEIGEGTYGFDPVRFGAKEAYTIDGGAANEVENANFNAASATFTLKGFSVHPGSAKGVMINALKIAAEIVTRLPKSEAPETTEKREGFYHPTGIEGSVGKATLTIILRDHDSKKLEARKDLLRAIAADVNAKYGKETAVLEIKDQYRNMEAELQKVPHLIENALRAVRSVGLEPTLKEIRGGTDGAHLTTEMGIPCPNLGTGGRNYHGESEYAIISEFEKAYRIVLNLAS